MISYAEGRTSDLVGLSTDTKPTDGILTNTMLLELDTGDFYYFDGTDWQKVGGE
jgi:hypothetical protein